MGHLAVDVSDAPADGPVARSVLGEAGERSRSSGGIPASSARGVASPSARALTSPISPMHARQRPWPSAVDDVHTQLPGKATPPQFREELCAERLREERGSGLLLAAIEGSLGPNGEPLLDDAGGSRLWNKRAGPRSLKSPASRNDSRGGSRNASRGPSRSGSAYSIPALQDADGQLAAGWGERAPLSPSPSPSSPSPPADMTMNAAGASGSVLHLDVLGLEKPPPPQMRAMVSPMAQERQVSPTKKIIKPLPRMSPQAQDEGQA